MISFPRLHWFEFHDLTSCPPIVRRGITECLFVSAEQIGLHKVVAPLLADLLSNTGSKRIIDLCSGAGGPMIPVQKEMAATGVEVSVTLTDKYPDLVAFRRAEHASGGAVRGHYAPVDATDVPEELSGMRTIFNGFHHFPPDQARAILQDAHDKREPIAIFEVTSRSFLRVLTCFPGSFFLMLGTAPLMRRLGWQTMLFTYAIPVLPLAFAWDGLVSCLRTYDHRDLRTLAKGLAHQYEWRTGRTRIPGTPMHVSYFLGRPT